MKPTPNLRPIRSYVRREGRMTATQQKAWETQWPIFGLSADAMRGEYNLDDIFGRSADKILEIGFGDGHSLAEMARISPEKDFIGIEVYRTGVGSLLVAIEKYQLTNIRIICADAQEILGQKIPDGSLAALQLYFADPWPKTRHHKRRLVQPEFAALVAKKLKKEGVFHLATDWMDYAYHMMSVLSLAPHFRNVAKQGEFIPRPDFRPLTKYEQRGLELGHQTWDLMFKLV